MNIKQNIPSLLIIILLLAVIVLMRSCDKFAIRDTQNAVLRQRVAAQLERRDSILKVVDTVEVYRTKVVTRWREVRTNDTVPCEDKLIICDTVIKTDSALIYELKKVISVDSSIIRYQRQIIVTDSCEIVTLNREVKKQRRRKVLAWIVAGVSAGIAVSR